LQPVFRFPNAAGLSIAAEFDFRQTGPQNWDILVETDGGPLKLSAGGARLMAGSEVLVDEAEAEYRGLYRRFVELTATGTSDVDLTPLRLVADAFLLGRRQNVEPVEDPWPTPSCLSQETYLASYRTSGRLNAGCSVMSAASRRHPYLWRDAAGVVGARCARRP
jgi:hypothetical protein